MAMRMASISHLDALPIVTGPNHSDAILVEDYRAGDMICPKCGLVVVDQVIYVGSEWRTFSNDKATKDPSQVGDSQNPLLSGADLSTLKNKNTLERRLNEQSKKLEVFNKVLESTKKNQTEMKNKITEIK